MNGPSNFSSVQPEDPANNGGVLCTRGATAVTCSSVTPSENDDEGIGSSLADLDSLTDLLPMMAPDLVREWHKLVRTLATVSLE